MRALLIISAFLLATQAVAQDQAVAFFAKQGCAIGPSTRALAMKAGITNAQIDALIAADDRAEVQGEWIVLSPQACKIALPKITSELTLNDPLVQTFKSDMDAFEDEQDKGCFLEGGMLLDALAKRPGWSEERAFDAYIGLLGRGLIKGELRFYGEDSLRTPPGFRVTTGACAKAAQVPAVLENHAVLTEHFGAFLRQTAVHVPCEDGANFMGHTGPRILEMVTKGQNKNAWLAVEYQIISIAAGWYEGAGSQSKGVPRPPLCYYE